MTLYQVAHNLARILARSRGPDQRAGPEQLRRPFRRFGEDYRATGRFAACLDRLKAALVDSTGDRIVESLRLAREVGGTDLGRLLQRDDPEPPGRSTAVLAGVPKAAAWRFLGPRWKRGNALACDSWA